MPEIITDQGLLVAELLLENIQEKNKLTSTKYPNKVAFDCGCGEIHTVNDPSLIIMGIAILLNFYFYAQINMLHLFMLKVFLFKKLIAYGVATFIF